MAALRNTDLVGMVLKPHLVCGVEFWVTYCPCMVMVYRGKAQICLDTQGRQKVVVEIIRYEF